MADIGGEHFPGKIGEALIRVPEGDRPALRGQIGEYLKPSRPKNHPWAEAIGFIAGGIAPIVGSITTSLLLRELASADSPIVTGNLAKMLVAGGSGLWGVFGVYQGLFGFFKSGEKGARLLAKKVGELSNLIDQRERTREIEAWLISEGIMKKE
ncbi:hypothetical protein A2153_03680 [Candidatus Gottesmanbacteria bacterium RBG_16_38_7b]|uniref:Uncharacterized protein n=2 Tax=Candidatus Gottesmaniibacteriota TaxID=1752720 RepID=A0A1F5YHR8_9BACT|nr:MAG: hypothetical protein A2153_03680 [Candidatus Gottesmanbacteria bacterium RBG_16_38_7b]OGG32268.1 MAG: hypothetical protein A3I51_02870 [Candidatus Gottesmanbacteria bacterium RIFCSPLOWO2_02_FULL_38_8]